MSALAFTGTALSGCGQMKDRDDKVVTVHESAASQQQAQSQLDQLFDQLKAAAKLYFPDGKATREGLGNFMARFRNELAQFLEGTPFTPEQLLELLFKFDRNRDGSIDFENELRQGLWARLPILRWIASNQDELTAEQLGAAIAREYPAAAETSRMGLARTLLRYDEAWAGGNANGLISRQELSGVALILGGLQQTDFSKAIELPAGAPAEHKLVVAQLHNKLNEQIYRRHKRGDYRDLPAGDLQLEAMHAVMKFWLCDKLANHFGDHGLVASARQADALKAYGFDKGARWEKLRALFDNALFGGNADGSLDSIELYNLVTELEYAIKVIAAFGNDLSAGNVTARAEDRQDLFKSILKLFPRAGQGLYMTGSPDEWKKDKWAARREYFDEAVREFDAKERGGNADGRIDEGELAMAFAYARIVDGLYDLYDTNHDAIMTKEEAQPLFAKLGVTDSRVVDAFFADIGLDGKDAGWLVKLKMFFSGKTRIDKLLPYDFHKRLAKVLPRVLDKDGAVMPGEGRRGD